MEKSEVIAFRKKMRIDDAVVLKVILDNMQEFNEDQNYMMWDDTDGILYAIRLNSDYHRNSIKDFPVEVIATSYENIQFISVDLSIDKTKLFLAPFIGKTISQSSVDKLITEFSSDSFDTHSHSTKGKPFENEDGTPLTD